MNPPCHRSASNRKCLASTQSGYSAKSSRYSNPVIPSLRYAAKSKGNSRCFRATSGTQSPWLNFAFFAIRIRALVTVDSDASKRLRRVSRVDPYAGHRARLRNRHNENRFGHDILLSALVSFV